MKITWQNNETRQTQFLLVRGAGANELSSQSLDLDPHLLQVAGSHAGRHPVK